MDHTKRILEIYDVNKLTPEDRRLIFQYTTESALFNASGKMNNAALFVSVTSFLIATYSIVYNILGGFTTVSILVGVSHFLIFSFFLYLYAGSNKTLDKIIENNVRDQRDISEKHFDYAKK